MSTEETKQPPLRPDEWLAFIIAAQGYRARSEHQQAFGKALIERYTVDLPKRFEGDPVATPYFDAMLCHVASAIRGMSVAATTFGTRWKSLEAVQSADIEAIARMQRFGPLSSDSHWSKAVNLLPGGAIAALAMGAIKGWANNFDAVFWIVTAGGAVGGLVLMQALVDVLVTKRSKRLAGSLPAEVDQTWKAQTLSDYTKLSIQFLKNAYEVTERFHGASSVARPNDDQLEAIAGEHFALMNS